MTTAALSARPLTFFRIEFSELYARHLCRHSQFGNNVVHLMAVFGTWFALFGIANWLFFWLGTAPWGVPVLAVA